MGNQMQNPFKKRATEFIGDPASFISLTSPEPLKLFFGGDSSVLFDRLVTIVGTPGSGKTTLARLLDLETLFTLVTLRNSNADNLTSALSNYQILDNLKPKVLAYRLATSSNLRDIWELPYSENIRSTLLKSFIQAKTVLGWMRKLEKLEVDIASIKVIAQDGNETLKEMIHAHDPIKFREFARSIEENILTIVTSLIPPSEKSISESLIFNAKFDAFEIIEGILVSGIPGLDEGELYLKPMLIIDDAHELHPNQFRDLTNWLKTRHFKFARWILTRVDAIAHDDFRNALKEADNPSTQPGSTLGRDHIFKLLQRERKDRRSFRKIARDISKQYIEQMPSFRRKGVMTLSDCLLEEPPHLSKSDLSILQNQVDNLIAEIHAPQHVIDRMKESLPTKIVKDQYLGSFRILLNREKRRTLQKDLFGSVITDAEETATVLLEDDVSNSEDEDIKAVKSSLIRGGEIQLLHEFERPFFFSFDRLADASGDNIEQFVNLADALVDGLETKLLRGKPARLDAREQHKLLTDKAAKTMDEWDFPNSGSVKKLIEFIAIKCVEKTREPNAPLGDGANAYGIPQHEMNDIQINGTSLISVLHFGIAYNAITLLENYECKNKTWCLFELGGLPNLVYGLTLNRGGFCEGHLSEMVESIQQ